MEILDPEVSLDAFFDQLSRSKSLLLLDYDGTIAPFTIHPEETRLYPGIEERVMQIQTLSQTTLIIISGRTLSSLIPVLGLNPLPELWGSHGGERRTRDGKMTYVPISDIQKEGLEQGKKIAETARLMGARLEYKPFSIALHWRGLDEDVQRTLDATFRNIWAPLLPHHHLEMRSFYGGLELRVLGINKGKAVSILQREYGEDVIAYLGDDATDEEAFAVLGKNGLKVLVSKETKPTCADIRITPPKEILSFLDRWIKSVYKEK
jgi:trehalose-phosphatase